MDFSIRFAENLTGTFRRSDTPGVQLPIAVILRGHIPQLADFLRTRRIEIEGTMHAEGLAHEARVEGTLHFDLFHSGRFPYEWSFVGLDGQAYRFAGTKTLRALELVDSMTTLTGEIVDADGDEVANVDLTLDLDSDLGRLIRSMVVRARGKGAPPAEALSPISVDLAGVERIRHVDELPGASEKLVVVTGAAGHLGLTLVRQLLQRGYRVRASVRATRDRDRLLPLSELPVEIVEADVLNPVALRRALVGADAVFHAAAGFKVWAQDEERDIFAPTVQGARNVIAAAEHAGVKKVILTSTAGAVGRDARGREEHEEHEWNDDARSLYVRAKIIAERQAWQLAQEAGIKLISLCPTAMIGPNFHRHTPATEIFAQVVHGKLAALPPFATSWVDVRDCAYAHLLAYESETASGRYLVSGAYRSWPLVAELITEADPSIRTPHVVIPESLTSFIPALDWARSKVWGVPRMMPKSALDELKGTEGRFSTDKIRRELGWSPMDFRRTVADTVLWIRAHFPAPAGRASELEPWWRSS